MGWMARGDHDVRLAGDTWEVDFPLPDDSCPLLPQPIRIDYVPARGIYACIIGETRFSTHSMPLFEILNELRGYSLLGKPSAGDVCVDLGAGAGITNVYLSARIRGAAMLAVEPDPLAAAQLKSDLERNGLVSARVIGAAVAATRGAATFDLGATGSSHIKSAGGGRGQEIEVRTMTLEDIVDEAGGRVDYLKADIEGAEAEIARSLEQIIRERRVRLAAVASYHLVGGIPTRKIIEGVFAGAPDVYCRTVYPRHPTTFAVRSDDIEIVARLSRIPQMHP